MKKSVDYEKLYGVYGTGKVDCPTIFWGNREAIEKQVKNLYPASYNQGYQIEQVWPILIDEAGVVWLVRYSHSNDKVHWDNLSVASYLESELSKMIKDFEESKWRFYPGEYHDYFLMQQENTIIRGRWLFDFRCDNCFRNGFWNPREWSYC